MKTTKDPFHRMHLEYVRKVRAAGYPTVVYYPPEGTSLIGELDWWTEDTRETLLIRKFQEALENIEEDDGAYNASLDELISFQNEIVDSTLAIVAKRKSVEELCHLLDAAAQNGSAVIPETAAGMFLRKIAELALRAMEGGK